MMSRGPLAYAHARIRAAKSRLLTRADAAPLFAAADDTAMQRVLAALEIDDPLRRVVRVYQTAIRGYREGAPLFRALLQRHEIENVKLLWRVTVNRRRRDAITPLWLDLAPLAMVSIVDAANPHELADRLSRTPYAGIAATVARVHGADLAAAELAFDRWMSQRLLEEARRLPGPESGARRLVELVVRERDAELVRRGPTWYGLTSVSGTADDAVALRNARLRLCRRAFVGSPFLLAPAVAVILLAEAEARAVRALVERQGDAGLDAPLLRALAGSEIGA